MVFVLMVLIALLAIEVGFWLGKRGRIKLHKDSLQPFATVVAAVLGMMAFVIASTVAMFAVGYQFGASGGRRIPVAKR